MGEPALLLHVHAALHYTSTEASANPLPYTRPNAPEYWLKLVPPESVLQALRTAGEACAEGGERGQEGAATLGSGLTHVVVGLAEACMERALVLTPGRMRQRYEQYGKKLVLQAQRYTVPAGAPDGNDSGASAATALDLDSMLLSSRITFVPQPALAASATMGNGPGAGGGHADAEAGPADRTAAQHGLVAMQVPWALAPQLAGPATDPNQACGVLAVKLPSVAGLMEWVCLDALREIDTPW